ncbi:hypothetical protein [Geomicrobium sediminis]|uniref:Small peptidoglycan-associated lipoprotein n=1 Tax=Geomicrobium sediminis TaxID=1347788 RepID=A0ABS2PIC8_9BACL|nr:hypothetical protein [Geomicrobium sediminis]MBM7635194.1 hypothetical protein [Geomicrobium sediminis]
MIACSFNNASSIETDDLIHSDQPMILLIYDDKDHEVEKTYLEAISTFHAEHPDTEVNLVDKTTHESLIDDLNLDEYPALVLQDTGVYHVRASGKTSREVILHQLRSDHDRFSLQHAY